MSLIEVLNKEMISWSSFSEGRISVNCKTEEENEDFLKECNNVGLKWCAGEDIDSSTFNRWSLFGKDTCYSMNHRGILWGTLDSSVEEYDVCRWEILNKQVEVKKSTKEYSIKPIKNKNNGGSKMSMNGLIKDFGKIEDGSVALTFDGKIAVRVNEGEYIRYNKETKTMENQMDLVIKEASDLIYIMPINEISIDDIIKHKNSYYQVTAVDNNKTLTTVNIKDGTGKKIIKETNIMGLSFYYKVISLFSQDGSTNSTTNGINPMMLMMLGNDDEDNDNLLPLLMMSGGMNMNTSVATTEEGQVQTQQNGMSGINPMMLMMMMSKDKDGKGGDSKMKDLIMMQMMSGQSGTGNQAMNPMMLMMMSDGKMDMKTLMIMQMMNQNK